MKYLIIICTILLPNAVMACEEMIAPEKVMQALGRDFATVDNYDIIKYALDGEFEDADTDNDGKLTLAEIEANQQAYYDKCNKAKNSI